MTVKEIARVLDAQWLCCQEEEDRPIRSAFASDMMSDVLAYVKDQSVLLSGLVNPQVIRTAQMMDMVCIVFVRGKEPDPMMISLAESCGIVLMTTEHRMFTACGLLYESGLRGGGMPK